MNTIDFRKNHSEIYNWVLDNLNINGFIGDNYEILNKES